MKRLIQSLAIIGVALPWFAGCSDDNPWQSVGEGQGRIAPMVSTDTRVTDAVPTRATETLTAPDAADFSLTLTKSDGTYSHTWASASQFPLEEGFAIGSYTLEAKYGDISQEGLNRPCFYGATELTVRPDETTEASVTATLANTMVSIAYTDAFKKYFATWSATLHSEGHGYNTLLSTDEAPMFLAPGNVTVALTFTKADGTGATIEPAKFLANARHHYHITMDVNNGAIGEAELQISFDDSLAQEEVVIDLSDELLNSPAPEVMGEGFTAGGTINVLQGTSASNPLRYTVYAAAGMKEVRMTLQSDLKLPMGNEVDFISLDESEQSVAKSYGINCVGLYKNPDKMGYVDLTNFVKHLPVGTHQIALVVKDKLTRITEALQFTVSVDAVELSLVAQPGAIYGSTACNFTMSYNGADFADHVTFELQTENGAWTTVTPVVRNTKPSRHAKTRSAAFPAKDYELTLAIPACTYAMPLRIYYDGKLKFDTTINVVIPEYTSQAASFATKAYLKVFPTNSEDLGTIVENVRVFLNGTQVAASSLDRDPATGVICIKGLASSTAYTIATSCMGGSNPTMATTHSVTTEDKLAIPNGDFSDRSVTVNVTSLNIGGKYRVSPVDYQWTCDIECTEPTGWASINEKTCYTGSTNQNTWYMVPSTMMENNSVLLRTVAYDHAGVDIGRSGGAFNTKYYCENSPSSIANRAAGELFLGSYSFDGTEHRTDGIAFGSRPSQVVVTADSYAPYGSDSGIVYVKVKDSTGAIIAQGQKEITGAGNYAVNLSYAIFGAKAASLEVRILSSTADPLTTYMPSGRELSLGQTVLGSRNLGKNIDYKALSTGSVLKISSVTVNY